MLVTIAWAITPEEHARIVEQRKEKIERELYPLLQATHSTPQTLHTLQQAGALATPRANIRTSVRKLKTPVVAASASQTTMAPAATAPTPEQPAEPNMLEFLVKIGSQIKLSPRALYLQKILQSYESIYKNHPEWFTKGTLERPDQLGNTYDQFVNAIVLIDQLPESSLQDEFSLISSNVQRALTQREPAIPETSEKLLSETVYDIIKKEPSLKARMLTLILAMHIYLVKNNPQLFTHGEFIVPEEFKELYNHFWSIAHLTLNEGYVPGLAELYSVLNKAPEHIKTKLEPYIINMKKQLQKLSSIILNDTELISLNPMTESAGVAEDIEGSAAKRART